MHRFRRITLALADAPTDGGLLTYARAVRDTVCANAAFEFVHVLPDAGQLGEGAGRDVKTHADALRSIQERVRDWFGDAPEACRVFNGTRVDRLLEHAAESGSDVILLGHRRERTGRRSLARRLAMKAPCSLWMVPEGCAPRITRIVAGVDFSTTSAAALQTAAWIANGAGPGQCVAVHVKRPEDHDGAVPFNRFAEALDLSGVAIRPQVSESDSVTAALLQIASDEDADLIVMGARGMSSSTAVLLGAESEQILTESSIPVLITRRRGEGLGLLQVLLDRDLHVR